MVNTTARSDVSIINLIPDFFRVVGFVDTIASTRILAKRICGISEIKFLKTEMSDV